MPVVPWRLHVCAGAWTMAGAARVIIKSRVLTHLCCGTPAARSTCSKYIHALTMAVNASCGLGHCTLQLLWHFSILLNKMTENIAAAFSVVSLCSVNQSIIYLFWAAQETSKCTIQCRTGHKGMKHLQVPKTKPNNKNTKNMLWNFRLQEITYEFVFWRTTLFVCTSDFPGTLPRCDH